MAPKKDEGDEDLHVFAGKTPWVSSTPNSRLNVVAPTTTAAPQTEGTNVEENTLDLPPEPSLPEPPGPEDSLKTLEHLRGLKQALTSLPPELEQKLQELEDKHNAAAVQLNHGHLNRMGKMQKQITALSEKIVKLDQDWRTFTSQVDERFRKHKALFLETRGELVKSRKAKVMELEQIKMEISKASQSLLNTSSASPNDVIELDDSELMHSLQQAAAPLDETEEYPIPDDDEEMVAVAGADGKPVVHAFQRRVAAGSPKQVAKDHLKPKETKTTKETK